MVGDEVSCLLLTPGDGAGVQAARARLPDEALREQLSAGAGEKPRRITAPAAANVGPVYTQLAGAQA